MTPSLWDFALDFYGRPGVSAACLVLQDEAGVDVIHLIVIVYADVTGQGLNGDEIVRICDLMADWQVHAVLPLRAVRRFLKSPLGELDDERVRLRETVKAVELQAEQMQLAMAASWLKQRAVCDGMPLQQALKTLLALSSETGSDGARIQEAVGTILATRATFEL
jgi:uncharacterized protein (TIGR02444 family)